MINLSSGVLIILSLFLAPLQFGIINRIKAIFAGRTGPPILQAYFDLAKLLRKGAVYSKTTTWILPTGPIISVTCLMAVLCLIPWGGVPALLTFSGDFILVFYLLGLARLFTILAAMDTGSSFEGMGASREALFSALTEPVLLGIFVALTRLTESYSLSLLFGHIDSLLWSSSGAALVLISVASFIILLTENSRIPVDDPNTHLELTMIHEVMVLDYSGPDFAYILYGSTLKLWIFSALLAGIVIPVRTQDFFVDGAAFLAGLLAISVMIGIVESMIARLRLLQIPQMLVGAAAVLAMSIFLTLK
jgi:formate hydrogenlyase subunit 4